MPTKVGICFYGRVYSKTSNSTIPIICGGKIIILCALFSCNLIKIGLK
jgi:hypothetical protein